MSDSDQTTPLTKEVAAILREYRGRLGLSQGAMGSVAGLSQSHMSQVLAGSKSLDVDQLEAISYSLGTDIDEVLERATKKVRDEGYAPDVPDFTVGGNVETANLATKRSAKKKDQPPAE